MKALIAAGGRATRMRPISYTRNKHLIPLANEPMIWNAITKLSEAGISDIIINVNPGETEMMRAEIGDGSRWGVRITYVEQEGGPKGVAHIIKNAQPLIGNDSFVFYLGDNIILGSLKRFVERFENEQLDCLLALSKVKDPTRFGVPEFRDGKIIRVIEKPDVPPSEYAVTGIYLYTPKVFEAVSQIKPSARGEYEISDTHTWIIEHGGAVGFEEITGWWKDTGKHEDLLEGNALLLEEKITDQSTDGAELKEGTVIQGNVRIGAGSVIGPNVLIRGPVSIGAGCVISSSYIGPYTSIGDRTTITNSEIEHSIVFTDAYVDCRRRIVDSIIGQHARITAAEQTLPRGNRMVVGDNAIVEL